MSPHFCWPWRFPQQCSAAGIVWKRRHGSPWTAIFHGDLLYKQESGRANRKTESRLHLVQEGTRRVRPQEDTIPDRKGGGRHGAGWDHFSLTDDTTTGTAGLMCYIDQPRWKRDSFSERMGASAGGSEGNVHFTKTQSISQHTGGSGCQNCTRHCTGKWNSSEI